MHFDQIPCPNCGQPLTFWTISLAGKPCSSCKKIVATTDQSQSVQVALGTTLGIGLYWALVVFGASWWLLVIVPASCIAVLYSIRKTIKLRVFDRTEEQGEFLTRYRTKQRLMRRWSLRMLIIIMLGISAIVIVSSQID
jgi:hypothetical protein